MARRNGSAVFSSDEIYRYQLGGDIGLEPLLTSDAVLKIILWIMLNPSTANAQKGDRTVDTTVRFSELWGYNRIMIGNAYAFRTKDPKVMWDAQKRGIDIVGPQNDVYLRAMVKIVRASGGRVMSAWGKHAKPDRVEQIRALAGEMYCLRTNKDRSPIHPLYQPSRLVPTIWEGMAA